MGKGNINRTNKAPDIIQNTIILRQGTNKSQEIGDWKLAKQSFDSIVSPNRSRMYDLLESIETDGQIFAVKQKRAAKFANKELLFKKDGKEDEEIGKLLNCPDMRRLMLAWFNGVLYSHSLTLINSIWWDEDREQYRIDFYEVPRKHVHPEPDFRSISKDELPARDFLYDNPPLSKYIIEVTGNDKYGILFPAAQYVIYKRGNFGDWADFAEMFGMPFREGEYDSFDEQGRVQLQKAMEEWGGRGYALHPKGTSLTLHQSSGGGTGSPYDALHQACNAEISKIFLGNTLTTEQGSKGTQALGSVHAKEENEIELADAKLMLGILNGQFKAILKRFGIDVSGGDIWFKSPDKDWTMLQTKWNVWSGIIKNGTPIDDEQLYNEFDIAKPDNYEELKANAKANNNSPKNDPNNPDPPVDPKTGKPVKQSDSNSPSGDLGVKRNWFIRLFDFFVLPRSSTGEPLEF